MNEYCHHVSGFFARRTEAEDARSRLVACGLPRTQVQIFDAESDPVVRERADENNEVLTNVLVDGAIGTAVGTGIGALAQLALVTANISLFIASPLVAPLAMLGWGASLGAFVGATAGVQNGDEHKEGWLSDLVRDAISHGQVVLLAQTKTAHETTMAQDIIKAAVGEFKDTVSTV